ncbi:MAG TPA: glycosyltransferase [Acidimicrobiales bacterium]|nr:glycosyltransferase [Acidimicrobiales bacterium]
MSDTVPAVSVCMPMSRDATVVRRALQSVLTQDFDDFEVLIGDETGAGEPAVAEAADPRVIYRRNPVRLGFSKNHVALLDRAAGRYMTVLHDDDWWEPTYLSSLVAVLDADPEVGLACCATVLDDERGRTSPWPFPLSAGRHDGVLETLLREDWFLLLNATMWRREVWAGPARQWSELCCADLQLFLSAADAGWALYYLPTPLAHWAQHRGQSGAERGPDHGLGVADDVLAFWDGWLEGRPVPQAVLSNGPRARWRLRQARALLLAGRTGEARIAIKGALALARGSDLARTELPRLRRLSFASHLPPFAVRTVVGLKRVAWRN